MSSYEQITSLDEQQFKAWVAKPKGEAKAAIIVIQEIFGVNPGIKQKCAKWAEQGYLAVAPDLFWRMEDDVNLDPDVESEFQHALDLFGKFDQDMGVKDLQATINHARALVGGGKVGVTGYCLGGRLAFMCATRTDSDASVGYYGVGLDNLLGEKDAIANPVMLHIPTADGFVPPETQKAMHDGLDGHDKVTLHDYEGLDHGFATETGSRRDDAAANLADGRTAEFFAKYL